MFDGKSFPDSHTYDPEESEVRSFEEEVVVVLVVVVVGSQP